MTNEQQFEVLWKVGCKRGILQIIANNGKPLSLEQIRQLTESAFRDGIADHVFALAQLSGMTLNRNHFERLIQRCLQLNWIPSAIRIAQQQKSISRRIRSELVCVCIQKGLANTAREAERLLGWA